MLKTVQLPTMWKELIITINVNYSYLRQASREKFNIFLPNVLHDAIQKIQRRQFVINRNLEKPLSKNEVETIKHNCMLIPRFKK